MKLGSVAALASDSTVVVLLPLTTVVLCVSNATGLLALAHHRPDQPRSRRPTRRPGQRRQPSERARPNDSPHGRLRQGRPEPPLPVRVSQPQQEIPCW